MEEVARTLGKEWIEQKIDTRMIHGTEVSEELRKGRQGGIPWLVVLDGDGNEVVTGEAPNTGNVGCPMRPEEIDWFATMLEKSAKHTTAEDRAKVRSLLEAYAKKVLGGS